MTTFDMSCPRCGCSLSPMSLHDGGASAKAFACECGGLWFKADALEKATETIEVVAVEIRHIPGRARQGLLLGCPECRVPMEKRRNTRDPKVVVVFCPSCQGTWLDKGELEAIRQEGLLTCLINTARFLAKN